MQGHQNRNHRRGYAGLPLALPFADIGQRVPGFDLDKAKVDKLNAGQSYTAKIPRKLALLRAAR